MSAMKYHHYPPLPGSSYIRVLDLRFNSDDASVSADFRVIDLDDEQHPTYYALSYACGNTDPVEYVTFPSLSPSPRIGIGKSLSDAFARLRYDELVLRRRVTLLWIDAICINQNDLVERAQQVKIMHRIFGSASLVLSWLGSEDGNDLSATVNLLQRFSNPLEDDDEGSATYVRNFSAAAHFTEGSKGVQQRRAIVLGLKTSTSEHEFQLLHHFFNKAWFTRLWVVQEAVVAKTMVVLCGREMIMNYEIVGMAACWFYAVLGSAESLSKLLPETRNAVTTTFNMRQNYQVLKKKLSLESRRPLGRLQFSEPRDEVFAIVGILNIPAEHSSLWDVDYSKSVSRVLASATRGLLLSEGLDVLNQACASDRPLHDELPSWVPNRKYQGATWITSIYQRFSASGSRRAIMLPSENEHVLSVSGTKSRTINGSIHFNSLVDLQVNRDCTAQTCAMLAIAYNALKSVISSPGYLGEDLINDFDKIFTNMTSCGADSFEQDLVNTGTHLLDDFRAFAYTWARAKINIQDKSMLEIAKSIFDDFADKVDLEGLPDNPNGFVFNQYAEAMIRTCRSGSVVFFKDHFGIASRHAEVGDVVTVLEGAKFPMILRRSEPTKEIGIAASNADSNAAIATQSGEAAVPPQRFDAESWKLVGPAYVHGWMDGEAFQVEEGDQLELEVYNIV